MLAFRDRLNFVQWVNNSELLTPKTGERCLVKTAAVRCCIIMTTSTYIISPKLSYNDHNMDKWYGPTLCKTHVHAGKEQEHKQGLQLHGQTVGLQKKTGKNYTHFCLKKKCLLVQFFPKQIPSAALRKNF